MHEKCLSVNFHRRGIFYVWSIWRLLNSYRLDSSVYLKVEVLWAFKDDTVADAGNALSLIKADGG